MKRKNIWLALFFSVIAFNPAFAQSAEERLPKLIVFISPTCHACAEVKLEVMPKVEREFAGSIEIEYRDITKTEDYLFLLSLKEKYHQEPRVSVPLFFMAGRFLEGSRIKGNYQQFIRTSLSAPYEEEKGLAAVDLFARFRAFRPLAIIGAGLIDGINPCAFTVIVFFISFLALQGYRKKELIIIGLTFIAAVFLTYLLLGLGVFNFFYQLKAFWMVSWAANIVVGALAVMLGLFSLFDFFRIRKSGVSQGLFLELPKAVKQRIHSIIGMHYRRADKTQGSRPHLFRLLLSALLTGFIVSLLEAICTGQVYLPTITFILKITPLKLQAWWYLFLYNLMFVAPLLAIFLFALWGATSGDFARFMQRHIRLIKLLMAALFFALGIFLLASTSFAQEEKNTWDFGRVKQGAVLEHKFTFKNETAKEININRVNTSCGCTVSKVKKNKIEPGRSTEIEVKFRTKGYNGPVQQFIYVNTDNPNEPIVKFTIKAEVIKK